MLTIHTRAQLATLTPLTEARARAFLAACDAHGWKVVITEGGRTRARQAELHAHDPSGAAPPGSSRHEHGEAFDVAFLAPDGTWSYDESHPWDEFGALAEACELVWGGYFQNHDRDHFELPRPADG